MSSGVRTTIPTIIGIAVVTLVIGVAIGSIAFPTIKTETTTTDANVTSMVSSATTMTEVYVTNTITNTEATYVRISGTNHSVFYITEVVVVQPEWFNDICIGIGRNVTISSSYNLPSEGMNQSNAIGIVTTSTVYYSSTKIVYNNITMVSNGVTTCTMINPYYNVTQTENNSCECI